MKPINKAILSIWVGLVVFVIVLHALLGRFVIASARDLEQKQTAENIERVRYAILRAVSRIERSVADWAQWDDTYDFVKTRNPSFLQNYLTETSYKTLGVDLMVFFDNTGDIVYAGYYDLQRQAISTIPKELSIILTLANPMLKNRSHGAAASGILKLPRCILLIASHPILTSHAKGPARGILMFGMLLNDRAVKRIAEITRLNVSIRPIDKDKLPPDFRLALTKITKARSIYVGSSDERRIAGYGIMNDVLGSPALIIRVVSNRDIYIQSKTLLSYVSIVLLTVSLTFGIVLTLMLWWIRRKEADFEAHKRAFYRSTILAATDGKLIVTEPETIVEIAGPTISTWKLREPGDIANLRSAIKQIVESGGMDPERASRFVICAGEAMTNAVKHAGGGIVSIHRRGDGFILVVADKGPGIEATAIPEVALRRGYSTAESLGIGYKVMISFADRVYLATEPNGTMVAIQMTLHEPTEEPIRFPQIAQSSN
jgi:sensor domain CHASE-containing protein/anti-sigma regulatory factor (Ser/Thr protein kinase)